MFMHLQDESGSVTRYCVASDERVTRPLVDEEGGVNFHSRSSRSSHWGAKQPHHQGASSKQLGLRINP